jgi:ABC-type multidrug transport system fused ATPase/permease subunit
MPWRFSLTVFLFALVNLSLAWQQWLIGKAIHDVESGNAVARLSNGELDFSTAEFWLTALITIALARAVFQYAGGVMALTIGQSLLFILREHILMQVQRLDLSYHWRHGMGEIVTRTTRDADKVRDALINFWRQVVETGLVLFASAALLCWYHPWLGLIPLFLTLSGIFIFVLQTEKLVQLDRAVGDAYDRVNQDLSEGVSGVRVIKSFALEERRIVSFTEHVNFFIHRAQAALAYSSSRIPFPQAVVALGHVWILVFGAHLVHQGQLNIGELVASLLAANTLVFRVEGIGRIMQIFADARSSAARIWELLDEEPRIFSGNMPIAEGPLGLRLSNVSIYATADTPVLRHCNLEVAPGEVVALVGATGSGKSTMAGLLPRLVDADKGMVLIGSPWAGWQDVKDLQLSDLRRKVHVVPQESFLFSDTLEANLRVSNPNATQNDIREALELTCSIEILHGLKDGLQTRVGDRGITLSGGQRQRICLARAILARPAILVLDDSTSALDALTERRILSNIRAWHISGGHHMTVLMVASKLSTILLSDRVVMLENGSITAEGTHEALISEHAAYRELLGAGHG